MTITTRSKRVSLFGGAPTPSSVGPGAYAPEKHGANFKTDASRPLYSGFASSDERNLNANKTTSAVTPGPGAYSATETHETGLSTAPSNAFATKISRFAPSAPGSTIYRASSIQDNPGPGAYMASSPLSGNNSNQSDDAKHPRVVVPLKPSAPTIPRKAQSYGYQPDPLNGDLRLQAQPSHIYSGIGHDTVGPAAYNTHTETIWDARKNVASSLQSTVKRDVWEEYSTPRRAVPGPGQYDPVGTHNLRGGGRTRRGGAEKPSAVFASRVPLLPEPKCADQYDAERDLELLAKDQRAQQRRGAPNHSKVEAFGSTTNRTDIATQLAAPFSSPTCLATPGPGKYAEHGPARFASFQHASLRRSTQRGRGAAYRDDQHIGFTSASERNCLSKLKPSASPGPGQYRSETPRTVHKDVQSKQTVGRFGVFGSTSERCVWATLERLEPEAITPGPGAYERPVAMHSGHGPAQFASSAAFKSASARFVKRANPHASPHVHCVGDTTAPAVGQYNLRLGETTTSEATGSDPSTSNGCGSPAAIASPRHSARAPFLSTAERSVFDPKDAQFVPGPGQYSTARATGDVGQELLLRTRSDNVRATLGHEERFRETERAPPHVGPGAYAIAGTVGTKSFNVTMGATAKPKQRPTR